MNAGGVPNTCKSNGDSVVIRYSGNLSGERVSNALVTCPEEGDNSAKAELIPHVVILVRGVDERLQCHFGRGLRPIS